MARKYIWFMHAWQQATKTNRVVTNLVVDRGYRVIVQQVDEKENVIAQQTFKTNDRFQLWPNSLKGKAGRENKRDADFVANFQTV
jgi:hypothetical protein